MIAKNPMSKKVSRPLLLTIGFVVLTASIAVLSFGTASASTSGSSVPKINVEGLPRIIAAMKTTMYNQVEDDEDIELTEEWIRSGAKKDDLFKNKLFPIIKRSCNNCHSKSSTMTRKAPHIPFAKYEDILEYTKVAPTNADCMQCHGDAALKEDPDKKFDFLYVDQARFKKSAHRETNCVRCHVILHPEKVEIYQSPEAFKTWLEEGEPTPAEEKKGIFKPTCAACHPKVLGKLNKSTHSPEYMKASLASESQKSEAAGNSFLTEPPKEKREFPKCGDCHGANHYMGDPKLHETKFAVVNNCGKCHEGQLKSYFASYHGKAAKLKSERVTKCVNCHGSHKVTPKSDPVSLISTANLKKTCQECHKNANDNFTQFIAHANHYDRKNYPGLYYVYLVMLSLIVGTFVVFGSHTALALNRSLVDKYKARNNHEPTVEIDTAEKYVRRFTPTQSILHLMLVVSFLILAFTGMTVRFPDNPLFATVADLVGGPHNMGIAHGIFGTLTLVYFGFHLIQLLFMFLKKEITIKGLFSKEYSMIPLPRDLRDMKGNLLYFLGKGSKPEFGRWTYWEKFEYLAEVWGTLVIGITGLALAFPEISTRILPGWLLNVATIIHSYEALMAVGFIFTIHFFHAHLRPEIFPMDKAIFTQRLLLSEFKEERPREYQQMVEEGTLEDHLVAPPSKLTSTLALVFGGLALAVGLVTLGAIVYSLVGGLFLD